VGSSGRHISRNILGLRQRVTPAQQCVRHFYPRIRTLRCLTSPPGLSGIEAATRSVLHTDLKVAALTAYRNVWARDFLGGWRMPLSMRITFSPLHRIFKEITLLACHKCLRKLVCAQLPRQNTLPRFLAAQIPRARYCQQRVTRAKRSLFTRRHFRRSFHQEHTATRIADGHPQRPQRIPSQQCARWR
jgi:hypothetical protein